MDDSIITIKEMFKLLPEGSDKNLLLERFKKRDMITLSEVLESLIAELNRKERRGLLNDTEKKLLHIYNLMLIETRFFSVKYCEEDE